MTFYVTGGYLFDLNENYKLKTMAMFKMVKNAPAQIDLTANLLINNFYGPEFLTAPNPLCRPLLVGRLSNCL